MNLVPKVRSNADRGTEILARRTRNHKRIESRRALLRDRVLRLPVALCLDESFRKSIRVLIRRVFVSVNYYVRHSSHLGCLYMEIPNREAFFGIQIQE